MVDLTSLINSVDQQVHGSRVSRNQIPNNTNLLIKLLENWKPWLTDILNNAEDHQEHNVEVNLMSLPGFSIP